jgi:hypothetical protein
VIGDEPAAHDRDAWGTATQFDECSLDRLGAFRSLSEGLPLTAISLSPGRPRPVRRDADDVLVRLTRRRSRANQSHLHEGEKLEVETANHDAEACRPRGQKSAPPGPETVTSFAYAVTSFVYE